MSTESISISKKLHHIYLITNAEAIANPQSRAHLSQHGSNAQWIIKNRCRGDISIVFRRRRETKGSQQLRIVGQFQAGLDEYSKVPMYWMMKTNPFFTDFVFVNFKGRIVARISLKSLTYMNFKKNKRKVSHATFNARPSSV
jgi:hypothetical protein